MPINRSNSFELLCELAIQEKWCDKLYCGTCGHTHFRYGLLEIAHGKSPVDDDWIVNSKITNYSDLIGKFPYKFSIADKIKIIEICLDADFENIRRSFLDIALFHAKPSSSINYRKLGLEGYSRDTIKESKNLHMKLHQKWNNPKKEVRDGWQ